MIERIRKTNRNGKIHLILVVIFAINMVISDDRTMFYNIAGIIWLDRLILGRKIRLDISDALIALSTFTYRLISNSDPNNYIFGTINVLVFYQIVKSFADPYEADSGTGERDIYDRVGFAILMIAVALFLRGILNYSYCLIDSAFISKGEWPVWNPRWSSFYFDQPDEEIISVEEHQFYLIMMGSLLPYFLMKVRESRILGIAGIILSALALWIGTLATGGFGFVCAFTAIIVSLIVIAVDKGLFKNLRFLVIFGAAADILTAFIISVKFDLFGIGSLIGKNVWSRADSMFYEMRFSLMGQALSLLPQYPFGGYDERLVVPNVRIAYFAHNSWIDLAVRTGFIPALFAFALLIAGIIAAVYVARHSICKEKYMFIAGATGITMYHMFEPGILQYFSRYWLIEVFFIALAFGMYAAISGKRGIEISLDKISERIVSKVNGGKTEEH